MKPYRFLPPLAAWAAVSAMCLPAPALALQPGRSPTLSNQRPACLLTLEVRQLHWTLDPVEHLKDHMNALQFDIPTDPGFCKDVAVGTVLDDKFRWGSWLFRQNYGQWSVRVVGKRVGGVAESVEPMLQADTVPPVSTRLQAAPVPVMPASAAPSAARTGPSPYDPGPVPALAPVLSRDSGPKTP